MKIAFIVGGFPVISETFITNHVVGLVQAGHEVRVYMRRPNWDTPAVTTMRGVDLLSLRYSAIIKKGGSAFTYPLRLTFLTLRAMFLHPLQLLQSLESALMGEKLGLSKNPFATWVRCLPFIDSWKPHVLHCHFGTNGLLGAQLVRSGVIRSPLVISYHGHDVHSVPRVRGRDVYNTAFATAHVVTANTNFTMQKVHELGCPKEKLRVIPMGFFLDEYTATRWVAPKRNEDFSILTVARLTEKKGINYALRAVSLLLEKGLRVRYTIIGDGELFEELNVMAKKEGISKNVQFLGRLGAKEVAENLRVHHIFLLPSVTASNGDMEGQALVLQEAQAVGLPVISTLHNGIPEGVIEGETGLLVPEKDAEALSEAIIKLYKNPKYTARLSENGKRFVKKKYDQYLLTQKWEDVYRKLAIKH